MPNKAQFIEVLAERLDGDKKRAAVALDAVIDTIYQLVAKGERVALTGFGAFERRERGARIARNPATGASVRVKKTHVPAFKAGAEFKEIAAGKRKAPAAPKKAAAAKKVAAKKTVAKKAPVKKAAAKKTAAKKAPAKKGTARKSAR